MPDVTITLAGDRVNLRCTLRAAKTVNAEFSSFATAFERLAKLDFAAYVAIIAAGLGKTPKDVEESVYVSGMSDLVAPLTDFVSLLANGGRPMTPDTSAGSKDSGNG